MSLRYAVLGLLADRGAASGYDLLKIFEISLGNVWPATQSQLYGELGKLTTDGLIEVTEEGPRGRKQYEITESGRKELRHWMIEVEPQPVRRDEAMLRVFLLGTVEPEQRRAYLRKSAARLERRLAELRELERSIDWDDDDLSHYGRLVMDYGKQLLAMRGRWFAAAAERLESASGETARTP
ncbi:PadR family transcriptional regulator [Nocardia veterana]|uniref:PadR family transcriptional regulator n=1 Tax=Nocardia veterana TaxID=132249 RepID=A0A7X6M437_9NOCA|nr:PadR family transcriptional regulator [Nocardia veterana]NKY88960.1 PadR family transcriptional regulator [Nocardia veterana]